MASAPDLPVTSFPAGREAPFHSRFRDNYDDDAMTEAACNLGAAVLAGVARGTWKSTSLSGGLFSEGSAVVLKAELDKTGKPTAVAGWVEVSAQVARVGSLSASGLLLGGTSITDVQGILAVLRSSEYLDASSPADRENLLRLRWGSEEGAPLVMVTPAARQALREELIRSVS